MPLAGAETGEPLGILERENAKLRKINQVLMDRVERSMDLQGNQFGLFETAILLEDRVRDRTAALERALRELERSNAALRQAKADADAANRSKTRFLAAAGHDLLQPLNAARLFVSALAEGRNRESDRDLLSQIDATFDSLEGLLRDLLEISRLDAGVLAPELRDLDVGSLMASLVAEFRPMAAGRGLELRHVPCRLWVRSDLSLLSRMLRNLISNAVRYTDEGRVLVGCRRSRQLVVIDVYDTGPGIPPERIEAVFEEFRRFDDSGRGAGYGLGLAIVQRAARVLGHRVEVRSNVGRGTHFTLHVPRGKPGVVAATPNLDGLHPREPLAGASVLVIDNEPAIRDGMTALLDRWACSVLAAPTVSAAIALLEAGALRPDLALVDYHLDDETSGTEAIEQIRAHYGVCLPAVVVTADRSDRVASEVAGRGLPILHKPVRPAKLRTLMDTLLRQPLRETD